MGKAMKNAFCVALFLIIASLSFLSRLITNFVNTNYNCYFNGFSMDLIMKDGNGILLMETTDRMEPPSLVLCTLESAARVYPDRPVVFFMKGLGNITSRKEENKVKDRFPSLRSFDNIYYSPLNLEELFNLTPIQSWFEKVDPKKETLWTHVLSDACRLALMWKYGGLYMDTDVISVRPIPDTQFVVSESEGITNNGLFALPRFSNLVWLFMKDFVENYNGEIWGHSGPVVFTRVVNRLCGKLVMNSTDITCGDLSYLHPHRFYPIPYTEWRRYFQVWKNLPRFDFSYGLHIWNHMNQEGKAMEPGSNTLIEQLYREYCPTTYGYILEMYINNRIL